LDIPLEIQQLAGAPFWIRVAVTAALWFLIWVAIWVRPKKEPADDAAAQSKETVAIKTSGANSPVYQAKGDIIFNQAPPQRNVDGFVALLRVRADLIAADVDAVIAELDKVSTGSVADAKGTTAQLKDLKRRLIELHGKHVAAIESDDAALAHELNDQIQEILGEMRSLVESRCGEIQGQWSRLSKRRYAMAPEPGQDPDYDGLIAASKELRAKTVDLLKSVDYPAKPPGAP
jgi:hypothetical protein